MTAFPLAATAPWLDDYESHTLSRIDLIRQYLDLPADAAGIAAAAACMTAALMERSYVEAESHASEDEG